MRTIEERKDDINADRDENVEGITEVTGRNSIKKHQSTVAPNVVKKDSLQLKVMKIQRRNNENYVQVQGECTALPCPNGMYVWQKKGFKIGREIWHISVKK